MVGGGGGGGGGCPGAQGQINGAREGGYKRALIKKPSRARCPFFPEGQKVMGEKKKGMGVKGEEGGWGKRYLQIRLRFLGSCVVAEARRYFQNTSQIRLQGQTLNAAAQACLDLTGGTKVAGMILHISAFKRRIGRRRHPPHLPSVTSAISNSKRRRGSYLRC